MNNMQSAAQRRLNGKMQHGSILVDFDYKANSLLFNSKNLLDNIKNLKKRITSIKSELNKNIGAGKLKQAVKFGFEKNFNFNFDFVNGKLSENEILLAEKLGKKYAEL